MSENQRWRWRQSRFHSTCFLIAFIFIFVHNFHHFHSLLLFTFYILFIDALPHFAFVCNLLKLNRPRSHLFSIVANKGEWKIEWEKVLNVPAQMSSNFSFSLTSFCFFFLEFLFYCLSVRFSLHFFFVCHVFVIVDAILTFLFTSLRANKDDSKSSWK